MKQVTLLIWLLTVALPASAQNFNEWWRQKDTQRQYLVEQVAALQVYIGAARKGYDIADKGLTAIGQITNGEFRLHEGFFHSLDLVNSTVKNDNRVVAILQWQDAIRIKSRASLRAATESGQFKTREIRYIEGAYDRLRKDGLLVLEELEKITADYTINSTDEERLQRLQQLYEQAQVQYQFTILFDKEIRTLAFYRKQAIRETSKTKQYYGITKN